MTTARWPRMGCRRVEAIGRKSSSETSTTARICADRLRWVKFASIAWVKDGSGFYYTRFPEPGTVAPGDENYFNTVYYHRLGDEQATGSLIFEKPTERETVFGVEVSDDDRWVGDHGVQGIERSQRGVCDRSSGHERSALFRSVTGFSAAYAFIESAGDRLLFRTDDRAPRGRIIAIDAAAIATRRPRNWCRRAATSCRPPRSSTRPSSRPTCTTPATRCGCLRSPAKPAGQVTLPTIGSLTGISGRPDDTRMFFGFTSFVHPAANYRYDFTTRAARAIRPAVISGSSQINMKRTQVWYPSKDGTRCRCSWYPGKGSAKDGNRPGSPDRLWRIQHQPDAGIRSVELRPAREGWHLRGAEPARRR